MEVHRRNNFDLLRILAALQVAITHAADHLLAARPLLVDALGVFPGVPIFFVISGFLVSASYERSDLRTYFLNRALRIYPGLWVCLCVSIAIAAAFGVDFANSSVWVLAQTTIVQFYNPDFLRGFGVGVLNGSLWTIPVELQFYVALPILYAALRSNRALLVATLAGVLANIAFIVWRDDSTASKLAGVTLLPYVYMFLLGVLLQRNRALVRKYLVGRLPLWLALYIGAALVLGAAGLQVTGNDLNPISVTLLACLVICAAYAKPLHLGQDLSYGLYIYHMPVINAALELGRTGPLAAGGAVLVSLALASLSWMLIEHPALRLKGHIGARIARSRSASPPSYTRE
jgi:peptidoglycan/LPS O-acetylase OafA/YrhL